MLKLFTKGFWDVVARIILRNKIAILLSIVAMTILFSTQWNNMRFTYTEANLLPDDHEVNIVYTALLYMFGEEGNLIVSGVKDASLLAVGLWTAWHTGSQACKSLDEAEAVLSIKALKKLVRNTEEERFELEPFIRDAIPTNRQ